MFKCGRVQVEIGELLLKLCGKTAIRFENVHKAECQDVVIVIEELGLVLVATLQEFDVVGRIIVTLALVDFEQNLKLLDNREEDFELKVLLCVVIFERV